MLDLSECQHLTNETCKYLGQNCPELQQLSLASCPHIGDDGLKKLRYVNELGGILGCYMVMPIGAVNKVVTIELVAYFSIADVKPSQHSGFRGVVSCISLSRRKTLIGIDRFKFES